MTWQTRQPYKGETRRFDLRSLTPDDVSEEYISWWNDPELQAGFGVAARGWGQEEALENLKRFDNRNAFHIGLFQKTDNRLVGFFTINMDNTHKVSNANFLLGERALWGTDVLLEVKVHLMDFMFNALGCVKLETKVYGRNLPSIYSSKAMGFKPEGVLRSHKPGPDSQTRLDVYLFGLLREEWEQLKADGWGPYK